MGRVKVLLLEDTDSDAELMQLELRDAGILAEVVRTQSESEYLAALTSFEPDLILADYSLPGFDGMGALLIRNECAAKTPFIFVTGALGDELAVATLRAGATDFVLKDRMARLPTAVRRALSDREQARERERLTDDASARQQLMGAILDTAKAAIVVLDDKGMIRLSNRAAEDMLGRESGVLRNTCFWDAFGNDALHDQARRYVHAALEWSEPQPMSTWSMATSHGRHIVWSVGTLPAGQNAGGERLVLCGQDLTGEVAAQEEAYILAHFDAVTGLPNRKLFQQQLERYCAQRDEDADSLLIVMMVELTRAQEIADSYGEAMRDKFLTSFVQRLRVWQIDNDLLARVADNTFALAFEVGSRADLDVLLPGVMQQLREPIAIGDAQWPVPTQCGVALYPTDAKDPYFLLQDAEIALHRAEAEGSECCAFYTSGLSDQARERLRLESELRDALKQDTGLVLHYQPQVDMGSGKVIGVESLIRWQHPRLGLLAPDRFIPLAEGAGLMPELGRWVLHAACRQMQAWQCAGLVPPTMAVNLSASQFAAPELLADIESALQQFGVSPALLELELTESTSMRDPTASIAIMAQLRHKGLKIAIDDFGTGYSNLSYLRLFPVDRLKLDRVFVRDITHSAGDLAISRAIIAMSHQLRLDVVAEGVETREQFELLSAAQCNVAQGYLFSRAVPAEACRQSFVLGFSV